MAEATRVMPLPASTVHVAIELSMHTAASCADGYVAQFGLTRRREHGGSVLSYFALTIATAQGTPTLAGTLTLVNQRHEE